MLILVQCIIYFGALHKSAAGATMPNRKGMLEMTQTLRISASPARDLAETGLESFASLSKSAQAIAVEAGEYAEKSLVAGGAAVEKRCWRRSRSKRPLRSSPDYAKRSYEGVVAQAARLGELYADLARDACKPFESIIAQAK